MIEPTAADGADAEAIRGAVTERAVELGRPPTGDIQVDVLDGKVSAPLRVFRAKWSSQGNREGLTGTIDADRRVNTYPNDALLGVWKQWIESGGLPDPELVAEVSSFVLAGPGPSEVVTNPEDAASRGVGGEAFVLPSLTADGEGIVFIEALRNGVFRTEMRVNGRIIDVNRERVD